MTTPVQPSVPAGACLVVTGGPDASRRFAFGAETTIGRADAEFLLCDEEVSRRHVEIRWNGEAYALRDLKSSNGTHVNGRRVEECLLAFGDELQLGNTTLEFRRHDPIYEQVLHRQRLEALGRLGAGIAHDFNNVLAAVLGNVDYVRTILAERGNVDENVEACFDDIKSVIKTAAELTPRLLESTRETGRRCEPVNVGVLCANIAAIGRRTFPRSIRFTEEHVPDAVVLADTTELQQVVMNLCLNARDALMPNGGELAVSVDHCVRVDVPGDFTHARGIRITVRDSGCGMDEVMRSSIFQPFFTTKKVSGHGIGLATARDVVSQLGGVIDVESAPGQGTTFRVYVPAAPVVQPTRMRRVVTRESRAYRAPMLGRDVRESPVLLVDDEPIVRRIFRRILEHNGFVIVEAKDGREAVRVYGELEPRPQLVLLDLDMPGMGGEEAARILRGIDADVRILVCTGHCDKPRLDRLRDSGIGAIINKPVGARKLLRAVENTLFVPVPTHSGARPG